MVDTEKRREDMGIAMTPSEAWFRRIVNGGLVVGGLFALYLALLVWGLACDEGACDTAPWPAVAQFWIAAAAWLATLLAFVLSVLAKHASRVASVVAWSGWGLWLAFLISNPWSWG
jgi:hypothetical protein